MRRDETRDLEICALRSGGETLREIAARYGVSRERVRQILLRNGLGDLGVRVGVGPLQVLEMVGDHTSAGAIAKTIECNASRVYRCIRALAPHLIDEMTAYRHEATRQRLIGRLQTLAKRLGHTPTKRELDRHGPSASLVRYLFGSQTRANQLAGLRCHRTGHPHLTPAQRFAIALRHRPGKRFPRDSGNSADLAREYGVSVTRVWQIATGYDEKKCQNGKSA